ncbi:transmembrane transport protein [Caballeronia fortuita]|uniref:Transmembrane transport protein n=1 Tax=Caballeronia fortuita TaxID=1777138 RepID=A0A158CT34_9BURK|nr:MFS transporter [Caballeronia fortuita]SAK85545.1 transmembrane transport protein [Caballeronia fortuita]
MQTSTPAVPGKEASSEKLVIIGSTLGTLFEWYDFFLYGAVASVFSKQFFSALSPTSAFLFALIAFGVGFAVRPLGALLFGRLGDTIGRKYTFLMTIVLMGGATFCVGLLPTYAQAGIIAPILLLSLRVLQGLGLGGEYGGAAIYVAEHAAAGRKGRNTSWIQMTGAGGTILALLVVFTCRSIFGSQFEEWAWRIPFLLSAVMLAVSIWIRTTLHESPVYEKMKAEGKTAKAPIRETFGSWANVKQMLIALFGLVMGVTTVLYMGQTYTFFFLTQTLHLDIGTASFLNGASLLVCLPLMWIAGALSDIIGRKKVILTGCLLAALTSFPIFKGITHFANPDLETATRNNPVVLHAPASSCSFQFDLLGNKPATSECDKFKAALAKAGVPYTNVADSTAARPFVLVGTTKLSGYDAITLQQLLHNAGYSNEAVASHINKPMVILLLIVLCTYFAMVYAPLAAALVEMFPARVRYTALSFPYHVGNGIFGGFFPAVAFAMVTMTGDIYFGIWYPVFFAAVTFVVGGLFLRERPVVDDATAPASTARA